MNGKLVANHRYNLRARLTVDGELMFTTDQSYPVFVDGQENQTNLLMRRVARHASSTEQAPATDSTTATSEFANTYWKLVSLKGQEVIVKKTSASRTWFSLAICASVALMGAIVWAAATL